MKYSRHSTGEDQLFDLATDPDEMEEISGTDRVRRSETIELLADALMEADDDARGTPVVFQH